MATIPTYGGPQVQAQLRPDARVSDAPAQQMREGAAALAAGARDFGGALNEVAKQEQEKANTARLNGAKRALDDVQYKLLNDPDHGAFSKTGQQAIGLVQTTMPEFDKQTSAIVDQLPSNLRDHFVAYADSQRNAARDQLARHSMGEAEKFYDEDASATAQSKVNNAVTNYQDPTAVDRALDEAAAALDARLAAKGAPEAQRRQVHAETLSKGYRGVVERTLVDDPNTALARLETYRPFLTGADAAAIEERVTPFVREADGESWLQSRIAGAPVAAGASIPAEGAAKSEQEADAIARASVGRTVGLESGGSATAKNPLSSATGAGQFLKSTWLDVVKRNRPDLAAGKSDADLLALRNDPALSKDMAAAYAVENCRGLFRSGLPVTMETAYLCHRFGLDGARKLLRSPPDTPVAKLFGADVLAANPDLRGKTVAELSASHARRAGEAAPAAQAAAPARLPDGSTDWVALKESALALPNPLQRRSALAAIERHQAITTERDSQAEKQDYEQINIALNRAPIGAPLRSLITPAQYARLEREGKVDWAEAQLRQKNAQQAPKDDVVLREAYEREAILSPSTFAKRNLWKEADRFTPQTLTDLLKKQKDAADPAKQAQWTTDAQVIDANTALLGFDPKKDKEKIANFALAFRHGLRAWAESNPGKTADSRVLDEMGRQIRQSFARNPNAGQQAVAAENLGMTAGDRRAMRDALIRRGIPNPSEQQVADAVIAAYNNRTQAQ